MAEPASPTPQRPRRSIASAPFDNKGAGRGPNGRPRCRWCGVEVSPPRRTWCSQRCVDEFLVRKGDARAVRIVFARDRGVCGLCGLDTESIRLRLREASVDARRILWGELVVRGFNRLQALYQVDHIRPVVEGGGSCGLENLRTLCVPCHKAETRALARRRAIERQEAAEAEAGKE